MTIDTRYVAGVAALVLTMASSCSTDSAQPDSAASRRQLQALTAQPDALAFRFELSGKPLRLVLTRAEDPVTGGYRGLRVDARGRLVESSRPAASCLYRGYVEAIDAEAGASMRVDDSYASISTCLHTVGHDVGRTIRGVVATGDDAWSVRAVRGASDGEGVLHRFVPLRAARTPTPLDAAVMARVVRDMTAVFPTESFREGTPLETKYVEVLAVNDERRLQAIGDETEADTIAQFAAANAVLASTTLTPRLRLVLAGQVTFEADPFTPDMVSASEVDTDDLLTLFQVWRQSTPDLPKNDVGVLMSAYDFPGNQAGLAPLDSMCGPEASAIVESETLGGDFVPTTVVHELGHTVGMLHDSDNGCADEGFIMAAVACVNCGAVDEFSTCSTAEFQAFLEGPYYRIGGECLDELPSDAAADSCGDGFVSGDEQCDCGASDCAGVDDCCDGATCQLVSGAECSDFNDLCCDECQVVSAEVDVTCRASRGPCDEAETCNGVSKSCPGDRFSDAATECDDAAGESGWCFEGRCVSLNEQCEAASEIFGAELVTPDARCGLSCGDLICQQSGGGACTVLVGLEVLDGSECDTGQCQGGACVTTPDQCPRDPDKQDPGVCGCGAADEDADGDDTADCVDGCPMDELKSMPGQCGCGMPDVDTDDDGVMDCNDECPNDPAKSEEGVCGCDVPDDDTDSDSVLDCNDECPEDAAKTEEGDCGCGEPETDGDGDGTSDCADECPQDATKSVAGSCGCGSAETDSDGDGTADCVDECPADAAKSAPGDCGCGVADVDGDGDSASDCVDGCPADAAKTEPGVCGCGVSDADTDGDGTVDCMDACPEDGRTITQPCGPPTVAVGSGGGSAGAAAPGAPGSPSDLAGETVSCSCRVGARETPSSVAWLGLALFGLGLRRRSARRRGVSSRPCVRAAPCR